MSAAQVRRVFSTQLELLAQVVLPDLAARRARDHELFVWCAGCGTGPAVSALAAMLEHRRPSRWRLLATDHGRFDLQVGASVRVRTQLRTLELESDSWPHADSGIAEADLVWCRAGLEHVHPEHLYEVAMRLYAALAPGGWIVTSAEAPMLSTHGLLDEVITAHGVAYQRPL